MVLMNFKTPKLLFTHPVLVIEKASDRDDMNIANIPQIHNQRIKISKIL